MRASSDGVSQTFPGERFFYHHVCYGSFSDPEQMYEDKKWLVQEPSRELVDYVMKRFDPDPDAGTILINQHEAELRDDHVRSQALT